MDSWICTSDHVGARLLTLAIDDAALCGVVTMSGFSDSHEEGYSPVPPIRLLQCILTVANSSA